MKRTIAIIFAGLFLITNTAQADHNNWNNNNGNNNWNSNNNNNWNNNNGGSWNNTWNSNGNSWYANNPTNYGSNASALNAYNSDYLISGSTQIGSANLAGGVIGQYYQLQAELAQIQPQLQEAEMQNSSNPSPEGFQAIQQLSNQASSIQAQLAQMYPYVQQLQANSGSFASSGLSGGSAYPGYGASSYPGYTGSSYPGYAGVTGAPNDLWAQSGSYGAIAGSATGYGYGYPGVGGTGVSSLSGGSAISAGYPTGYAGTSYPTTYSGTSYPTTYSGTSYPVGTVVSGSSTLSPAIAAQALTTTSAQGSSLVGPTTGLSITAPMSP